MWFLLGRGAGAGYEFVGYDLVGYDFVWLQIYVIMK